MTGKRFAAARVKAWSCRVASSTHRWVRRRAKDPALARKARWCAFEIFERNADGTRGSVEPSVDGCVLCELCIQTTPGKVWVVKRYE